MREVTTVSERLARFALGTGPGDLPGEVLEKVKLLVLDGIGLCFAACREEFATEVTRAIGAFDTGGPCTVFGFPTGFGLPNAPLVNGMLIHAYDFDDTHHPLVIHNESVVLPVALASAEQLGAGGWELLTACAVGFETSLRVARAALTNGLHRRGFHPTAVCGVFGGVVATGRMFGVGVDQMVCAMGLAGSIGSGNMEWQSDGSWSKRFQPGWSAHGAIMATMLAREGFTAPRTALEGPRGFWVSHLGEDGFDPDRATDDLGSDWEIERIEFKPYPCGGVLQAIVRACVEIHANERFDPGEVVDVECRVRWDQRGVERVNLSVGPGEYGAHFSVPLLAASALVRGRLALDDFALDRLRDPAVTEISERVRVADDPQSGRPRYASGEVRVRLADGETLVNRQHVHPGHVENPLSAHEVQEKFLLNATRVLADHEAVEVMERIAQLEHERDFEWLKALARG